MFRTSGLRLLPRNLRLFPPRWSNSFISAYWKSVGPRVSKASLDKGKEPQKPCAYTAKTKLVMPPYPTWSHCELLKATPTRSVLSHSCGMLISLLGCSCLLLSSETVFSPSCPGHQCHPLRSLQGCCASIGTYYHSCTKAEVKLPAF